MGGSNLGGDPAGYAQMHMDTHAWIISGGSHDGTTYTPGSAGIKGHVEDLIAAGSPFSDIAAYDPSVYGEPLPAALDRIDEVDNQLDLINSQADFEAAFDAMEAKLVSAFSDTDLNALVNAFDDEGREALLRAIADINRASGDRNVINSSFRALAIASVEKEHMRAVEKYEADLRAQRQSSKIESAIKLGLAMLERKQAEVNAILQTAQLRAGVAQVYSGMLRQYQEDEMNLRREDAIWPLKMLEFMEKGLGSISGASIIPADPGPVLRAITGVEMATRSVGNIFGAASSGMSMALSPISMLITFAGML